MVQPHDLLTSRKKVKTGCRTCKVRRVKCDEDRPACRRCVSTGRVCDGYGIWGGGTIQRAARTLTPRAHTDTVQYAISSQFGKLSPEQETCLQWFRRRTHTKLPLPFITPFWHTLILQACATEPAILHAALALGSAHQKETFEEGKPAEPGVALDSQQKFMLREYGEAIRSLQPHFTSQDRRSIHVALAACALFTFFENLLGRYAAANAHLHSGLKLVAEIYGPVDHLADGAVTATPRGYVDDWIIESFVRLHVQVALLGQGLLYLHPRFPVFPTTPIPTFFESANQAAHHMDRLMLDILHLEEQCSLSGDSAVDTVPPTALQDRQRRVRGELKLWLIAYNATDPEVRDRFSPIDEFYMKLLGGYHAMATLIIKTCTCPTYETMYDLYTADFISLIEQLVAIWKAHIARPAWRLDPSSAGMPRRISHSVGEKGWIPLLYFVAIKCRVHRIRVQAIQLMSQTLHKEGIWDSRLALVIAKEIIRVEEGDYYRYFDIDDRFSIVSIPTEQDIALPPLPDHRRLYSVHVRLPEHSMGILTLEYEQRQENAKGADKRTRCYDLRMRRWVDAINESRVYY
ncbi:hypothetical protein E0Z10_g4051 [Xylaria hypoxylon]|uniref:Zn(2)-C6 fungal-type domain-containing protein n=1 Tax=Xylaria hypoxylon TaxID=37992 RepID=A0A4Z0Z836_9PEZI|nr:hypothetical protein E0Z10_g4051 [Xylaria hypoxylon]